MLDLPGRPVLDKLRLVGACARLPITVDAGLLRAELAACGSEPWGSSSGRIGSQRQSEAVFLRGYAPSEGERPIVDREWLDALPSFRELICRTIDTQPQRAVLARLPPKAVVSPHVDRAPYFSKTLRVHVPIETHDEAWMVAGGLCFRMRAGEVWVLNNSGTHAVWNGSATLARTHLICDYLATPRMLELLRDADRSLGAVRPDVVARVTGA